MMNYEAMYKILFNAATDAINNIKQQNFGLAVELLKKAQLDAEEIYIKVNE
jgi:hypothetical protein